MTHKEIIIAKTNELDNGEMKTIEISEGESVLLIRIDDQFYATDAYCPHYDASLELGVLSDNKLICSWHHAVFDITTGDVSQPPALEGLRTYQLEIRGDDIILFPENKIEQKDKKQSVSHNNKADDRTFIIIGSGAAGNSAARKLRELGYNGHLKIISADSHKPYDRTTLSKDFLKGDMNPQCLSLHDDDFFEQNRIEFINNHRVNHVDAFYREIKLDNDTKMKYDKLLVASGGEPKKLEVSGNDLENIFTLRSLDDANKILKCAENNEKIAIIGASFIGLETADHLRKDNREIHVIAHESVPFAAQLGEEIGQFIQSKMEEKGINFHLNHSVSEFRGNGKLEDVVLDNGQTVSAGLAIIGIGVQPVADFLPPFDKVTDGSLLTDRYLQVENDIYAAGDVATFPYWKTNELIRIEHWRVAQQLGAIAASNMISVNKIVDIIPFFWVNLAGMYMRYVGYADKYEETIIDGDVSSEDFVIYYSKDNQVSAALGVNRDEQIALIEELLRLGKMPAASELKNKKMTLKALNKLI
jgi:NADPH-dependent 2,4-dienoyl-CoA reductase/sulfur reductase-like enzyme/nitrite reductase/ring-hydroxylating ferredoxin subunit